MKTIIENTGTYDQTNCLLQDLIKSACDNIPAQYLPSARLDVMRDPYDGTPSGITLTYERPMTEEELAAEADREKAEIAARERAERAELYRLKNKYGV